MSGELFWQCILLCIAFSRGQHCTKMITSALTENLTLFIISSVLLKSYMMHCVCNSGFRKDKHDFLDSLSLLKFLLLLLLLLLLLWLWLSLLLFHRLVIRNQEVIAPVISKSDVLGKLFWAKTSVALFITFESCRKQREGRHESAPNRLSNDVGVQLQTVQIGYL